MEEIVERRWSRLSIVGFVLSILTWVIGWLPITFQRVLPYTKLSGTLVAYSSFIILPLLILSVIINLVAFESIIKLNKKGKNIAIIGLSISGLMFLSQYAAVIVGFLPRPISLFLIKIISFFHKIFYGY